MIQKNKDIDILKDKIKDKSLLLLNDDGSLTLIFEDFFFNSIKNISFNLKSKLLSINTNDDKEINILLRKEILKVRNNILYLYYSSFNNYLNNENYISIDLIDFEQINEEEDFFNDFLNKEYNENILFGNFRKLSISNISNINSLIEII